MLMAAFKIFPLVLEEPGRKQKDSVVRNYLLRLSGLREAAETALFILLIAREIRGRPGDAGRCEAGDRKCSLPPVRR